MLRNIHIRLTKVGSSEGPFNIYDQYGNLIEAGVTRDRLLMGVGYILDDSIQYIRLVSMGRCSVEKVMPIVAVEEDEFYYDTVPQIVDTACVYSHLTDKTLFNTFYGQIAPYVIEYPFAYKSFDQIVQSVKDYTRVYRYTLDPYSGVPFGVEQDDVWFNKAIIYNGQQCSGLLKLVPKPKNNLKEYMSYPKYNTDSKTIIFTKSDSYYQYNTFWDVVKDNSKTFFLSSYESLSIDKVIDQSNMDYTQKSFRKYTIRGKDTKIRHILDDQSNVHLVSKFIYSPSQISYK